MEDSTWWERFRLGKKFDVWRLACIYHFLVNLEPTLLDCKAQDIISRFQELESEVIRDSKLFYLGPYLYAATGIEKFNHLTPNDVALIV
jgi:hypothetical protein